MKVKIDAELCTGHGRCWAVAKDVFQLDDNGYNAQRGQIIAVPPGKEAPAMLAVSRCPERAISIVAE